MTAVWILLASVVLGADGVPRGDVPRGDVPREGNPAEQNPAADARSQRPVMIRVHGPIDNLTQQYFHRKLEMARQLKADLLIVEVDSPGGLLHSSCELATTLRDVSWARTVAFIPKQALSGAAILSLGCDEIVIAEDATFGDAGVIKADRQGLFRHAEEKIRSVVVAHVRALAEAKGRSPALAEAMVDKDLVVYSVKNQTTGQETFLSDHEIEASPDPGVWEKGTPVPESRKGLFLTVSGKRAVELKLAQAHGRDTVDLQDRYRFDADLTILETNWVDTTVMVLNSPLVTGLLFVVGLIALYVEFCAPGTSVGGLISGLCFALFFWSRFLGGTSGWLEILLFCAGVVFLLVELFVIPGFGVAGITGLLLMLVSVFMASQDFRPQDGLQPRALANTLAVVAVSGVLALIGAAAISKHLGALPMLNSLALAPPPADAQAISESAPALAKPGEKPTQPLGPSATVHVGDWGVAASPLRPAGKAAFAGEYLDVVSDGSFIDKGRQVRVVQIRGNHVVVRDAEA